MKKLASLLTLCSIGLFAVGCSEVDNAAGPEPIPGESPAMEGGSGDADITFEEGTNDAPPTTEETPPALTEPSGSEAAENTGEAEPTEP